MVHFSAVEVPYVLVQCVQALAQGDEPLDAALFVPRVPVEAAPDHGDAHAVPQLAVVPQVALQGPAAALEHGPVAADHEVVDDVRVLVAVHVAHLQGSGHVGALCLRVAVTPPQHVTAYDEADRVREINDIVGRVPCSPIGSGDGEGAA